MRGGFSSGQGGFKAEVAKLQLRELWALEKKLLLSIDNYPELLRERNVGEMRMTEHASVTGPYDSPDFVVPENDIP